MALPATGELKFSDIYTEIYTGSPSSNDDIGLYDPMTMDAGYQPKAEPHTADEFHGYDHGSYATLSLSPSSYRYSQAGGSKTFTVTASIGNAWQAQISYIIGSGWMSFNGSSSGVGTGSPQYFTVDATTNSDGPPDRTGTITVVSDAPNETSDIVQDWH